MLYVTLYLNKAGKRKKREKEGRKEREGREGRKKKKERKKRKPALNTAKQILTHGTVGRGV